MAGTVHVCICDFRFVWNIKVPDAIIDSCCVSVECYTCYINRKAVHQSRKKKKHPKLALHFVHCVLALSTFSAHCRKKEWWDKCLLCASLTVFGMHLFNHCRWCLMNVLCQRCRLKDFIIISVCGSLKIQNNPLSGICQQKKIWCRCEKFDLILNLNIPEQDASTTMPNTPHTLAYNGTKLVTF